MGPALEPPPGRNIGQPVGEKLDGDRAIELGIERAVDDAHAAFAERLFDAVRPELGARRDGSDLRCAFGSHRLLIAGIL